MKGNNTEHLFVGKSQTCCFRRNISILQKINKCECEYDSHLCFHAADYDEHGQEQETAQL